MHQFFVSAGASSGTTPNPAPSSGSSAASDPAPNGNPSPGLNVLSEEQRRSLLPDLSPDEQRLILLDWLETDDNIGAVLGRQRTEIGRTENSRATWTRAANYYNGGLPVDKGHLVDYNKLYQRFARYKKSYFKTAQMGRRTGDGVDPLEGDDGYDDKLERLCPGFARLHEMLKNNPHLHPACEVETTSGQLQIGSRSRQITLGRVDEADEADAVFITDDDLEDEDEEDEDVDEGLDNRPIANNKTKGKKFEDDEEPNASTSSQGRKYNGQAFQSHRSRSPAASTSSKSTAKRGRSAEQSNSSKKDSGSSSKSGSAKKVTPLGLHDVKPPQKGKSPTDIAKIFDGKSRFIFVLITLFSV